MNLRSRVRDLFAPRKSLALQPVSVDDPPFTFSDAIHSRAFGASGTTVLAGRLDTEEWNRDLEQDRFLGTFGSPGVADHMRKSDPDVRMALQARKLPLLAAREVFEPSDATPLAVEIADFASWCFFELIPWYSHKREALLSDDYGVMLFETIEGVKRLPSSRFPLLEAINGTDRGVVFTELAPRLPRTVHRWVPQEAHPTRLAKIVQWVGYSDGIEVGEREIPAKYLLRYVNEQEAGNFLGTSVLRAMHKPWRLKEVYETLDGMRHERQNLGILDIEVPGDASEADLERAEEAAPAISSHAKGFFVHKAGTKLAWNVSGQGRGTDIEPAIQRLRRAIADAALSGHLTMAGAGDTGSYALAETLADYHLLQQDDKARAFEDAHNIGVDGVSQVKRLIAMNYGDEAARNLQPKMRVKGLRTKDYAQIIPLVISGIQAGVFTDPARVAALERFMMDKLEVDLSDA